ncbi:hypothetical protein LINPERHAP1_LOCUS21494 [Linum perenne]
MTFTAYRVVKPLICYFSVQWHRCDRVLRQFGMDKPLPMFDMPRSEVIINLEITQRGTRQKDWVPRYPRLIQFYDERFDNLVAGPWLVDHNDRSFHCIETRTRLIRMLEKTSSTRITRSLLRHRVSPSFHPPSSRVSPRSTHLAVESVIYSTD